MRVTVCTDQVHLEIQSLKLNVVMLVDWTGLKCCCYDSVVWCVFKQDEDFATLTSTEPAENETGTSETDDKVTLLCRFY